MINLRGNRNNRAIKNEWESVVENNIEKNNNKSISNNKNSNYNLTGTRVLSGLKNECPKLYLFFEGYSTEVNYFKNIVNKKMFRNALFELCIMRRDFTEISSSKPSQVYKLLEDTKFWIENNGKKCSLEFFIILYLRSVIKYFSENNPVGKILSYNYTVKRKNDKYDRYFPCHSCIKEILTKSIIEKIKNDVYDVKELTIELNKKMNKIFLGYSFDEIYVNPPNPPLDEDRYFIIVDRDQASFSQQDVDTIYSNCIKNNYVLIISNPNFEFWIALHDQFYNKEQLLVWIDNCLVVRKKKLFFNNKYLIRMIKEYYIPDYEKNIKFNFIEKKNIIWALNNSKDFQTKIDKVCMELSRNNYKDTIGTNIIDLFKMLDKNIM